MRTLSAELTQAQKDMGDLLCKITLTAGTATQIFSESSANILLKVSHTEQPYSQRAQVLIDNSDGALTALNLEGYQGVLSYGYTTSAGDEYSACAPLIVKAQELFSTGGLLSCQLILFGIPDQMNEDKASILYDPPASNTDTVKTIINAIAGTTLACYSHCTAITVDWDVPWDDGIINTFQPKDSFSIAVGESRLAKIKELLGYTKCVMVVKADGHIHIFTPTLS